VAAPGTIDLNKFVTRTAPSPAPAAPTTPPPSAAPTTINLDRYMSRPAAAPSGTRPRGAEFGSAGTHIDEFVRTITEQAKNVREGKSLLGPVEVTKAALAGLRAVGNVSEAAVTGGQGWRAWLVNRGVADDGSPFSPAAIASGVLAIASDPSTYVGVGTLGKAVKGIGGLRAILARGARRGAIEVAAQGAVKAASEVAQAGVTKTAAKVTLTPDQIGIAEKLIEAGATREAAIAKAATVPKINPQWGSRADGLNPRAVREVVLGPKKVPDKVPEKVSLLTNVSGLSRALKTTFDLSAPFRQGIVAGAGHPITFAKNIGTMLRVAASKQGFDVMNDTMAKHADFQKLLDWGLDITSMAGRNVSKKEEVYATNLIDKLAGKGVIGKILTAPVQASERAYTGFLSKFRFDLANMMIEQARKGGRIVDDDLGREIARYVNIATGRGDLGKVAKHAEGLAQLFFAPRFIASRVNIINPRLYIQASPVVRREAMRNLLSLTAAGLSVLKLAQLRGAEVGMDPTSSDFGQIIEGDDRVNIWGGIQPQVTFLARMLLGKTTSVSGAVKFVGTRPFKETSRAEIALRFARSKASPFAGLIYDWATGKTIAGQKLDLPAAVIDQFVPMMVDDITSIAKAEGTSVRKLARGLFVIFGGGARTYGPRGEPETTGARVVEWWRNR